MLLTSTNSFAENEVTELDTIVVTGVRQTPESQIPKNVTVIDSDDIARSTATQLSELLSQEANINLRSFTGNDKYSSIDIRGMGDTSSSNVLVLVDGVRLNNDDLSGPDLSTISISQIERIEVVRSGGTVRYGNGAVGGVVNIITKSNQAALDVYAAAGSFDTHDLRFNYVNTDNDNLTFKVNLADYDTDGYRDNGYLSKQDVLFSIKHQINDQFEHGLMFKNHRDEFGLPGPVSRENYEGSGAQRKSTTAPQDGGESKERLIQWHSDYTSPSGWLVDSHLYYRERFSDTLLQYTPTAPVEDQILSIEDRRYGGDLILSRYDSLGEFESEFSYGFEAFITDYQQYRNGRNVLDQSQEKKGDLSNQAFFADWALNGEGWRISTGGRFDKSELEQDEENLTRVCDYVDMIIPPFLFPIPVETNCRSEWLNTAHRDETWNNTAFEVGAVYQISENIDGFVGYATSFRNPNVDELVLSDEDLAPQTGKHWDIGVRFEHGDLDGSVTLFTIKIEDEILYGIDPVTRLAVNRNADQVTRRDGVELDIQYGFLEDSLSAYVKAGYINAAFIESGTFIPLVPRVNATIGLEWQPTASFYGAISTSYTDERFDGNDFNNSTYPKLDAYRVTDIKLSWQENEVEIFLSVLNVFDEVYSTSGYSGTFYPMPERNFMAGIKYSYY